MPYFVVCRFCAQVHKEIAAYGSMRLTRKAGGKKLSLLLDLHLPEKLFCKCKFPPGKSSLATNNRKILAVLRA
jgi:hypothetical protein